MDPVLQLMPGMVTDMEVNAVVIISPIPWAWDFSETGDSAKNYGVHLLNMLMSASAPEQEALGAI